MSQTTKGKLPRLPFVEMKNAILGSKYSLSLAFIGPKKMQTINLQTRNKNYATDILSFPLDASSGEILICLEATKRKAKDFEKTFENYLGFLFIHGLLHLKGFDHGPEMEKQEEKFCKKFGF